jgi:DNA-binding transcriptional ArsR family regulator
MSIRAMTWAFDVRVNDSLSKLVLLKLADHANEDGECWPSVKVIAEQCELSRRSVQYHLRDLEGRGFITSQKQFNGELQSSNLYKLGVHHVRPPAQEGAPPRAHQGAHKPSDSESSMKQKRIPLPSDLMELQKDWDNYFDYRKEIGKPLTQRGADLIFKKFRRWGTKGSRAAMDLCIESSWTGVQEPRKNRDYNTRMRKLAARERDDKLDREIEEVDRRRRGEVRNVIDLFNQQQDRKK